MPKVKISEFSSTPANNTDIDSINIAEGCAPSGINDAIRELMAQLKDFQVGSAGDPVTVGGVLTVQAGSASTPALTTAGDTNTGIFFPAADTIAFAEGGAEVARIDSSGNLGLGVTPSAWSGFKVLESTAGNSVYFGSSQASLGSNAYNDGGGWRYKTTAPAGVFTNVQGSYAWFNAPSGTAGNAITFTQAMTLTSSGNQLLGTTSDVGARFYSYKVGDNDQLNSRFLTQNTANTAVTFLDIGSNPTNNTCYLNATGTNSASLLFRTDGTERARITSGGDFLVGTTSADGNIGGSSGNNTFTFRAADGLRIAQNGASYWNRYTVGATVIWRVGGGDIGSIYANSSSVSYNTTSDYRLKNTIAPMTDALAKVALLKPVTYKWNADGSDGEGFIAHELAEVCPQAVAGEKDAVDADGKPVYQGVDTSFLVATLTAALQEQQAIISAQSAVLESLKARLDAANL
jgi:hypothetical protein